MSESEVFILGGGAIGLTLATYLMRDGKQVALVRTSSHEISEQIVDVSIEIDSDQTITAAVKMVSLSQLEKLDGIAVVTAKSYANQGIAKLLKAKHFDPIIIVMQNGINVEQAFVEAGFSSVYRCVLYATAQKSLRVCVQLPQGGIFANWFDTRRFRAVGTNRGDLKQPRSYFSCATRNSK